MTVIGGNEPFVARSRLRKYRSSIHILTLGPLSLLAFICMLHDRWLVFGRGGYRGSSAQLNPVCSIMSPRQ